MEKIVVNSEVAPALVPECLDAPAAWTLALVARAKGKDVSDLVVFVLGRPRHEDLIHEIREAGARVMLRSDGDVVGALKSYPWNVGQSRIPRTDNSSRAFSRSRRHQLHAGLTSLNW